MSEPDSGRLHAPRCSAAGSSFGARRDRNYRPLPRRLPDRARRGV